jgi:LPS export ABC transporter protein LptC
MIEFFMKRVVFVGVSVLLFSLLFLLVKNGRETGVDIKLKGNSFFEGLKIVHKKSGVPVWTLTAKKADFQEDESHAELSDISMTIQKNNLTVYAKKGIYNLQEQSFTTEDVLKAETKGYTITADTLDYEVASGKMKTDGRIKIEGKKFEVEGKGLKADSEQKVSILNDVTATFNK